MMRDIDDVIAVLQEIGYKLKELEDENESLRKQCEIYEERIEELEAKLAEYQI